MYTISNRGIILSLRHRAKRNKSLLCNFAQALILLLIVILFLKKTEPFLSSMSDIFLKDGTTFLLQGIPYAVPPVGVRRWHPPEPIANGSCEGDTIKAVKTPPQCAQKDPVSGRISGLNTFVGKNTCANLDRYIIINTKRMKCYYSCCYKCLVVSLYSVLLPNKIILHFDTCKPFPSI